MIGNRASTNEAIWDNWVIDVTRHPEICFYPQEPDGSIVVSMVFVDDRCPGKLVGVYHKEGKVSADIWCRNNPSWHEQYRHAVPTTASADNWKSDPRIKITTSVDQRVFQRTGEEDVEEDHTRPLEEI